MFHYNTHRGCAATLIASLLVALLSVANGFDAQCTHPIYCQGPVLEGVQFAGVFNDSKTFVDLPLRVPPAQILAAFNQLPPNSSMADFVNKYFYPVNSDLISVVPKDWDPNPSMFASIKDPEVLEFANVINSKWLHLVRQFNDSFCEGCYSHISVPNPFVIAGSRFREYYYWDTYWALDGLLLTDMQNTAKGIIENFLGLVQQIGFVPNGGRIYYLNRSQPPMLIQMMKLYYASTGDLDFLTQALPTLDAEYSYWMTNTTVKLDSSSVLNRYYVNNSSPRPESYAEDTVTASGLNPAEKANLYMQLATTAETGWDFSTRWMSAAPALDSLVTTSIIPVDLNCILYANEITMAEFHEVTGNPEKGVSYRIAAGKRLAAIQAYLYNSTTNTWNDFNFVTGVQNTDFYASQFLPFWAGVYEVLPQSAVALAIKVLLQQFSYPAGIPTSLDQNSGEQWDFPNGWAPLQYFAAQGFFNVLNDPNLDDPAIRDQVASVAEGLAQNWVTTNYCAYKKYNVIFEKFDVTKVGSYGSGGEYTVQDGFGWTNGVALRFIAEYADTLAMGTCPK